MRVLAIVALLAFGVLFGAPHMPMLQPYVNYAGIALVVVVLVFTYELLSEKR